jgi:hypothetical protein
LWRLPELPILPICAKGCGEMTGIGWRCRENFRRFRREFADVEVPELPILPIFEFAR